MKQGRSVALTAQELTVIEHVLAELSVADLATKIGLVQAQCLQTALSKIALATRTHDDVDLVGSLPATGFAHPLGVMLDEQSLTIWIDGEAFVCKPTSFRILSCLVDKSGQWVRADALALEVLGGSFQKGASNLRWHVLQARRALGARGAFLHSDNRLGYMFDVAPCSRKHCSIR
jgi:hypothetical protein